MSLKSECYGTCYLKALVMLLKSKQAFETCSTLFFRNKSLQNSPFFRRSRFNPNISHTFSPSVWSREQLLRTFCSPFSDTKFVTLWLKYVPPRREQFMQRRSEKKRRFLFPSHSWTIASSASDKRLEKTFLRLCCGRLFSWITCHATVVFWDSR